LFVPGKPFQPSRELKSSFHSPLCQRRRKKLYNIDYWKTFTDCFNCLPVAAIVDEKIFCCHGGLSPDLRSMDQASHFDSMNWLRILTQGTIFYRGQCALFYIENDAGIFPVHYAWKVAEKGLRWFL